MKKPGYIIFTLLFAILAVLSCVDEAPTVPEAVEMEASIENITGTIYPRVQNVYPGVLYTTPADLPMTGISPNNPGIILVFTKQMQNTSGELYLSVDLLDALSLPVSYTLTPDAQPASVFTLTPSAVLDENAVYTIRIHSTAYETGAPSRTLIFDNWITDNTASYIDFRFETSDITPADVTGPALDVANTQINSVQASGAVNVPIDLGTGYITIVFDDDSTPVADPTTITSDTVTLYNVTDSAVVTGSVYLSGGSPFDTYHFYPDGVLLNDKQYRLRVSAGDTIADFTGNLMSQTDIFFRTVAKSVPVVDYYSIDSADTGSVTISWATDTDSIGHIELDSGNTFVAGEFIVHDTALNTNFTKTISGLTPNRVYSLKISVDTDTSTPSGGPFDPPDNYLCNAVFRTLPDTNEGATGNYKLAESNAVKSRLQAVQISDDESLVFWEQTGTTDTYSQFVDTSAGAAGTWDKWPDTVTNQGVLTLNTSGSMKAIYNGSDGAIAATVSGGSIYADSVFDAGGTLGRNWGTTAAGVTVYTGSATDADMALTYSGYVQVVTSGTAEVNFLFDSAVDFSALTPAVAAGDHVINEASNTHYAVSSLVGTNLIIFASGDLITSANLNYRIGDNSFTESAAPYQAGSGTTLYSNNISLDVGDVVFVDRDAGTDYYTYLASFTGVDYTTEIATTYDMIGDSFMTYRYMANGTADTNVLYDAGIDFTSPDVAVNDIVINTATGVSDKVSDDAPVSSSNDLLVLSDASKFLFDSAASATYQILRLPDHTNFITSGRGTSAGTDTTVTETGRDFAADGVQAGDVLYGATSATYAEVDSAAGDTITLTTQINNAQAFIVMRYRLVTFVLDQGDDIRSKTIDNLNGDLLFPVTQVATDFYNVTDVTSPIICNNPHVVSDLNGNSIVVYEYYTVANLWDIKAKKIAGDSNRDGNLTFSWADPANDATDAGISVNIASTRNDLLIKTIEDGNGGAWTLYTSHTSGGTKRIGVSHINGSTGAVTAYALIDNADHPDMTRISATGMAVAYELNTAVGSDSVKRIYVQRYLNTPALNGVAVSVRSANEAYSQLNPRIIPDNNGGCIVSWLETKYYPSVYYSIFAQHFASGFAVPGDQLYGDDKFVGIPVLATPASANPYNIEHGIIRYDDSPPANGNAGIFFWLDQRSANPNDIYFQNVAD